MSSTGEQIASEPGYIEVYPVVHVVDNDQAMEQAKLALDSGADGIYLINHGGSSLRELLKIYENVSQENEGAFIGINLLGVSDGPEAMKILKRAKEEGVITRYPDAIWSDFSSSIYGGEEKSRIAELREEDPELKNVQYLGGVAFKYTQNYTDDPQEAASEVINHSSGIDVITTSGPGTAKPISLAKARAMKEVAGDKKLAIASGVDISNIGSLRGIVDVVLVASSVETEPYSGEFVPEKLTELIAAAHSSNGNS